MKTSEERQHVSSSEQSDSGDGDIPFETSTDTRSHDITMETDHSENADNKGAILYLASNISGMITSINKQRNLDSPLELFQCGYLVFSG